MPIAALDVHYQDDYAAAACVLFHAWASEQVREEQVVRVREIQPYVPGQFWQRELPCLEAALHALTAAFDIVVIDGYVWLDANQRMGLGAHLFKALGERIPVIGVAKTSFNGSPHAARILRGTSQRPLYVTAAGIALEQAAAAISAMHGQYRIPTMLKRVDELCRSALTDS